MYVLQQVRDEQNRRHRTTSEHGFEEVRTELADKICVP